MFLEADAVALWQVEQPGTYFGWAVSELADLDGDGVTDVVTSDPFDGGYSGFTVVLSGRDGRERFRYAGPAAAQEGYGIADGGDLDGDGLHDVLSGAPGVDQVHVLSGADGTVLRTLTGGTTGESLGASVSRAGDVDGDGVMDVLAGAETANVDAGRVYVFSGASGAVLWSVDGAPGQHLGSGSGYVGDTDGDGIGDLVVGARTAGTGGEVWLLSGADGAVLFTAADPDGGGSLGQFFVAGVGDLDGDGIPDVYGGDYANPAKGPGTGRAFVWSGADGHAIHTFTGDAAGEGMGPGRGAGDVDGDGVPDLVIGSWTSSDGAAKAGKVTVFSGADGQPLRTVTSTSAGEDFGFDAIGMGDVDQDGAVDLLVSAATGNRVYLIGTAASTTTPTTTPTTPTTIPTTTTTSTTPTHEPGGCGCDSSGGAGFAPVATGWVLALIWRRRSRRP